MPNLKPPVATVAQAAAYRARILAALEATALPAGLPARRRFEPLMTLYLTDNTPAAEIAAAKASGFIHAVKYYPAGATTNSDSGVTALERAYPALAAMERHGVVLSLHGEVTDSDVDVFDRERVFVDRSLGRIVRDFPALKVVLEHVTTREAAQFVSAAPANVAATLTPQHLLWSRNALFAGGIRPHFFCLPVLKRESHRQALVAAATSGSPEVLPRHRQRAACAAHQGERLRLRRMLFGAGGARVLRRGVRGRRRARSARGLRELLRRRLLRPAAPHRHRHAGARDLDPAGRVSVRRAFDRAPRRRRGAPLAAGGLTGARFPTAVAAAPRNPSAAAGVRGWYPSAAKSAGSSLPRSRGGGKSGLRRAGCRVTPGRHTSPLARPTKARNRATETSRPDRGSHRDRGG